MILSIPSGGKGIDDDQNHLGFEILHLLAKKEEALPTRDNFSLTTKLPIAL